MSQVHTRFSIRAERLQSEVLVRLTFLNFETLKPHSRRKTSQNKGTGPEVVAQVVDSLEEVMADLVYRTQHPFSRRLKSNTQWELNLCSYHTDASQLAVQLLGMWLTAQDSVEPKKRHPIINRVSIAPHFYFGE